jgi:hypothetical protein
MGLFPRYPASPAAIVESADELLAAEGSLESLTGSVRREHRAALGGVDGELEDPMRAAPESTLSTLGDVSLAARYARAVWCPGPTASSPTTWGSIG